MVTKKRSAQGSLVALMIVMFLFMGVLISCLGMDVFHYITVKRELQNATDAGALAGAQELWTSEDQASADAYTVSAFNNADGRAVSNSSPQTEVAVTVEPPAANKYGTVTVNASMRINHLFATIIGRTSDTIRVVSVAGSSATAREVFVDQLFPLAVSWDTRPHGGQPLSQAKIGERIVLLINAQKFKNSAFTSLSTKPASGSTIQAMIEQALGLKERVPGFIPDVKVDDIINLNNGVVGQKRLASQAELSALTNPDSPPLILPVIMGDPSFNQGAKVVGFIGFKVTDVVLGQGGGVVETITGVLSRVQVNGQGGAVSSPTSLNGLAVGPVQLIR